MTVLPEPVFIDTDPAALTERMVADWEGMTGKTLLPAQPERLFIDWLAYQFALQRMAMQEVGKQSLLAYARFPIVDYQGQLVGVARLPAQPAQCTVTVELAAPAPVERTVTGLSLRSGDGRWTFAQAAPITIPAGADAGSGLFVATVAGAGANGYLPGAVATLDGPMPDGVTAVANVSITYGGAEAEDDDRLRARIQEAPERFSTAGPAGAYRWQALSAHASIRDVAVVAIQPGRVRVVVLTDTGSPSAELLDLVAARLSADRVRPLSDTVEVVAPERVAYDLRARVTLAAGADAATARAAVDAAAAAYVAERRGGLGRDLVPSQAIAALSVPGVHRVELAAPAFLALEPGQWADAEAVEVTVDG